MKFTLAEVEKVTAAYFSSNLFLTATAFELLIIFLIAAFPLLKSQSPTDPEPSMTITSVIDKLGTRLPLAAFIRRVYKQKVSHKIIFSDFDGRNFLKLWKRKTRLKIKRTKKQYG